MFEIRTTDSPQSAIRAKSVKPATALLPLTTRERETLVELSIAITADPAKDPILFSHQASEAALALPSRIRWTLRQFAARGSASGILVLANVPIGAVPETPPDNSAHVGERTLLARAQAIINHAIGHMIAYEAEGDGRLFQDMVPKRTAAVTQTSLGFGVELELHTEQAFSKLKPDWVSLACLSGHDQAKTYVLPVSDLLPLLSEAEASLLREPLWVTGVDESFRVGGHAFIEGDIRGPMPILGGSREDPSIVLDQDLMLGTTDQAEQLFRRLLDLYVLHRRTHVLHPGEVLLLDNRRAVHGRSPFQPRWDGQDRFIVRSFAVRDIRASAHAREPGSLTVKARFS